MRTRPLALHTRAMTPAEAPTRTRIPGWPALLGKSRPSRLRRLQTSSALAMMKGLLRGVVAICLAMAILLAMRVSVS
jgi:hypothetical protein